MVRRSLLSLGIAVPLGFASIDAHATVTISSAITQNMSCSGGICAPTASDATLNVTDLENLLAVGDVTVTTTGSGVEAINMDVQASLGWSAQTSLSLTAYAALAVDQQISIPGQAGLSLITHGYQSLIFGNKGRVVFQNPSGPLTINGSLYSLVNSISSLASAIASNPSGAYALGDDYDAAGDGTYADAPVQTDFTGILEGLGNTISHLSIANKSGPPDVSLGLFADVGVSGVVQHLHLSDVKIRAGGEVQGYTVGALVGYTVGGYFFEDSATGAIELRGQEGGVGGVGGLAGVSGSTIDASYSAVDIGVANASGAFVGGLVGANSGLVTRSFATGSVVAGDSSEAGGLAGVNDVADIENSYATGAISGGMTAQIGGLIGRDGRNGGVTLSYSTGAVSSGVASYVGGFIGWNQKRQSYCYWDTTTSGTSQSVGKGNAKHITGLTTEELQSGLPQGFDPSVWGEKSSINNGLPYLVANPPPK